MKQWIWPALLLLALSVQVMAAEGELYKKADLWPNSLTYQAGQSLTELNLKNIKKLRVQTKSFSQDQGEVTQVASRLQIKKVRTRSRDFFDFSWGPTGSFAYYPFAIDSRDVFFNETDFQFFRAFVGYGPEIRFKFSFGAFLLSASPGVQYSWVSWSSPVSGGAFSRYETSLLTSIQFLKPLTKNIFVQIFADSLFEDTSTWERAMTASQGFPVDVKQVRTTTVGLALGYNWN